MELSTNDRLAIFLPVVLPSHCIPIGTLPSLIAALGLFSPGYFKRSTTLDTLLHARTQPAQCAIQGGFLSYY